MMNALISIMSNTFTEVYQMKDINIYREKALMILESETVKSFFTSSAKDDFKFLMVC